MVLLYYGYPFLNFPCFKTDKLKNNIHQLTSERCEMRQKNKPQKNLTDDSRTSVTSWEQKVRLLLLKQELKIWKLVKENFKLKRRNRKLR